MRKTIDGKPCLFLTPLHRAEVGVASHLLRLLTGDLPWGQIDPARAIPWVEQKTGRTFSPSQRDAVAMALQSKVTVITGGPGVGKTTIVTSILQILQAKKQRRPALCPHRTGRETSEEATGLEAKTIHRLLEFEPTSMGFVHGHTNPLRCDLVVVDEVSMVDVVVDVAAPPGHSR